MSIATYDNAADWDFGLDTVSESQYGSIVQQFSTPKFDGQAYAAFHAALKARHFIYWHNESNPPHFHNGIMTAPGDCGYSGGSGSQGLQTVSEIGKGTQFTGIGLSVAHLAGVGSIAGAGSGGIGAAGTALAGVLSVAGWAVFGAGLVLAPLSFILAHHAKAVAIEQNDLCGIFREVNPLFDDIDAQFYAGNITMAQASQALSNLRGGVQQALAGIRKECNAACIEEHILDGLIYLRTDVLYPSHQFKQAAKVVATGVGVTVLLLLGALALLGKAKGATALA